MGEVAFEQRKTSPKNLKPSPTPPLLPSSPRCVRVFFFFSPPTPTRLRYPSRWPAVTTTIQLTCAGGMLSFHSLQALDFFFSFFSVAALVIHLCPMPWDEPLVPSSSSSSLPSMIASPVAAAAAAAAAVAAATPATTTLAAASAAATAADFLSSSGGGGGSEDGSSHRRRSRGIPTGAGDESDPLGDGGGGDVNDGLPPAGLQQVEEETDHLLLLDDNNLETKRSSSAHGRSRTWNRHQHHGGSGTGVAGSRKGSLSSLSADGKGSKSHRRWTGGGSGGGSDGGESLVGGSAGNGKEEPGGGAGSRLASLYVCLIPPLLVGVTDHPTAGANLAVVFAMCGGLLAFSWGRLVVQDMREKARAEAVAAVRQRWQQQRQERWRAGSVGSTAAAVAALDMDWDEEEGRDGGADAAASAAASAAAAAAGGGRVSSFNGSNGGGVKHTAVCSPSSGWSLREDEEVEQGEEEGQQEELGEAEGMLPDRPTGGSYARAGGAQLQRGGGGGVGDGNDPVGSMLDDAAPSNDFPSSSPAFPTLHRPRARSIGGNRSRRGEQQGAGSGWSATSGSGRMLDDDAAAMAGSTGGGGPGSGSGGGGRSESATRLGRLRTVLRSLKRVTVRQGLLDWRQLGVGVAGFAAGLACFAVQGSSSTAGWYHVWHGAWHVLAMGSAVPLLRARKWGPEESDADENGRLWGCGGSGSPGQGGGQQPQLPRSVRAVGLRARWESLGPGFGGRVETRPSSYEMVPKS